MTETKEAELIRCYYRSIGQNLTTDVLNVEFEVDGKTYTQGVPNSGWGLNTPALQSFGFIGIKPTDMDGQSMEFDRDITVGWSEQLGQYVIPNMSFAVGKRNLQKADWFNPNGTVWNSGNRMAFGGMSVDPNRGNRAAVEVGEDEN
jgi:hypothetical protein